VSGGRRSRPLEAPPRQPVPVRRPIPASVPGDVVTPRRYARMLDVLERRQPDLTVVLENVHDPHNAGAVLRSCDAVGVGTVHVIESAEPLPELASGATASAHLWVDVERHASVAEAYRALRERGFAIVAAAAADDAVAPWEVDFTRPTALVLGNEHDGVSVEAAAAADLRAFVPMRGMVQSLNVSVAAGVLLYEAMRQRAARGMYDAPRLPEPERQRILARWLERERERRRPR
jgi:tRNA (guanosine-2'-O-)-methyltransferase